MSSTNLCLQYDSIFSISNNALYSQIVCNKQTHNPHVQALLKSRRAERKSKTKRPHVHIPPCQSSCGFKITTAPRLRGKPRLCAKTCTLAPKPTNACVAVVQSQEHVANHAANPHDCSTDLVCSTIARGFSYKGCLCLATGAENKPGKILVSSVLFLQETLFQLSETQQISIHLSFSNVFPLSAVVPMNNLNKDMSPNITCA